jgi:seryl-tRNA synthetase
VRTWGEKPRFDFEPKPHWELAHSAWTHGFRARGQDLGSGFLLFTGRGARLERALIQFMLDFHVERHGYARCRRRTSCAARAVRHRPAPEAGSRDVPDR